MADTKQRVEIPFKPEWHFQEPIDWRDTDLDEDTLKQWFHLMLLGRQIDYRCQVLNRQGRAPFIISGGSPVATQMVHGAGAAYALKMDGTDKVLMTCYGEGAGAEGDAHEAFNFAAIYKLPEIFVCQNNGFAISVPFRKEYAIEYAAQRAAGYGFPGVTVDGRDPVTCYHVSKQAVARARAGEGPTLIECLVDRLGAHSSEDDQRRYRSQEQLEHLTENDCLQRYRRRLLEEKILSEKEAVEYEESVKDEVNRATREALDARDARPEEALTHVYGMAVPDAIVPATDTPSEELNMVQAVRECLLEEMERDPHVMVL